VFSLKIDGEIELRLLEENHIEVLFALVDRNRRHLRQWLPWLDRETSLEDTRQFITSALDQFALNGGLVAGIWFRGRITGVISYNSLDWANRIAHIGYWVAANFQGRGIVTRACRGLINHAFNDLEMNRVEIRCATGNKKSCAIPQRLGFTQEGLIREAEWLYDHYVDHLIFGMLAKEWKILNG
jgi:ribosomal-protein-serine acetyltransferase